MIITADHSTDRGIYTLKQEKLKNSFNKNNFQPFVGIASKFLSGSVSKKFRQFYVDKKINTKKQKKHNALKNISELTPYEKRIQNNLVNPSFSLFDDRFRTPLLFTGLGLKPKIIDQQIRSIDIFPSISDIIEVPSKTDIDGLSVLPLINGEFFEERPALMQIITNWLVTKSSSDTNVIGIRFNGFKYFRSRENSNEEIHLYDLKNDPYEENNLALEKPEKVNQMELILSEIQNDYFENESKKFKDLKKDKNTTQK